ncbi:MAG: 3',5'-cyclic-AMP phosphodiesterase [Halioglobus sp.]
MSNQPSSTLSVRPQSDTVSLVQVTDCHLSQSRGGTLLEMDTDDSLSAVLQIVREERAALDLILATGDLSDHGAEGAYKRLLGYLDDFRVPHCWLPGNHDDRSAMERSFPAESRLYSEITIGRWHIVMLDSQIPGEVGGQLGDAQIRLLEQALEHAAGKDAHVLICLHHQPVPVGSDWLDKQQVSDADALFKLTDQHPRVKGILWGHVHQQVDIERNGVKLMATPSTCVQFAPELEDFRVDDKGPGYRWLELTPEGDIRTGVSRVTSREFMVDLESGGYS